MPGTWCLSDGGPRVLLSVKAREWPVGYSLNDSLVTAQPGAPKEF